MGKLLAVAAVALAVVGGTAAAQQAGDEALTVSAVRFFSPGSATTTIEAVCEVRLGALFAGPRVAARYRVEVAVLDSTGLELQRGSFSREVPAAVAAREAAAAVESFGFTAAPGRYALRVRAVPEQAPAVERVIEVRAYDARPQMSDLLLATEVRLPGPGPGSDDLAPGEVRRAGLVMRTAPVPLVQATDPSLSYYAELYSGTGEGEPLRGELRVQVVGGGGRVIVETAARPVEVGSSGAAARGSLDLTGLPEGSYRLRLRLSAGDGAAVAEAPFRMGSLAEAMAAARTAESRVEEAMFADSDEPRLDSLYGPVAYLLEPGERGVYGNLSPGGKRRFLREFWRRRDPTPHTPDNPAMAEFYRAVGHANERFREGGAAAIPGWRTDRGRIYLKHGRPDETWQRPQASPRPYEIWKYTRERQRNYVFYDQSGLGNYYLLATNDRLEQGLRTWDQFVRAPGPLFGAEEVRAAFQFMGIALTPVEPSP